MRALELYGIYDQWQRKFDLETPAKPRITLRYLNQLKLQRKRRQREQAAKMPLLSRMYGDWERQELDALSQQISDLDAQGASAEDVEAANRALRKMARRTDG